MDNPRGINAVPPATPTPLELQATFQCTCVEALQQLALYAPGREAMLNEAFIVTALDEVVERGLTNEARLFARTALLALSEKQLVSKDGQKHVMLSYQVCVFSATLSTHDNV